MKEYGLNGFQEVLKHGTLAKIWHFKWIFSLGNIVESISFPRILTLNFDLGPPKHKIGYSGYIRYISQVIACGIIA